MRTSPSPIIAETQLGAVANDGAAADAEAPGDDAGRCAFLDQLGEAAPLLGAAAGRTARQLKLDMVTGREMLTNLYRRLTADHLDQPVLVVELAWRRKIDPIAGADVGKGKSRTKPRNLGDLGEQRRQAVKRAGWRCHPRPRRCSHSSLSGGRLAHLLASNPIMVMQSLRRPGRCPAPLLPFLAWGLSVDLWEENWPEVGISLVSPCTFRLRRKVGTRWDRCNLTAEPRSVYLLRGPSRYEWEHGIPAVNQLRYSLTFRNIRENWA